MAELQHSSQVASTKARAVRVQPTAPDLAPSKSGVEAPGLPGLMLRLQRQVGNQLVSQIVARALQRRLALRVDRKPAPKAGSKAAKKPPKPPSFELTGIHFILDGTTVRPASKGGKTGGWVFTSSAAATAAAPAAATGTATSTPSPATSAPTSTPAPAGGPPAVAATVEFKAERPLPGSSYSVAGGATTPLLERARITISGDKASVDEHVSVLAPAGGPPQLTIPFTATGGVSTTSQAVGTGAADALDLTSAGLTPTAGDVIHLATSNRTEVYVYSSLKAPDGKDVKGYFDLGHVTKIQHGTGVEGRNVAPFDASFKKLVASKSVSAAEAAESDIFSTTSEIEGGFGTVQSADRGVMSFGFGQWTAAADLAQMLKNVPAAAFQQHLGQYGLGLSTPVLGTHVQVRKFIPGTQAAVEKVVDNWALRNPSEGCLTLSGSELVSQRLFDGARAASTTLASKRTDLQTLKTEIDGLKADLASGDKAKVSSASAKLRAAATKVGRLWAGLAGLPGVPQRPPKGATPDVQVDALITGVTDAQTAADNVVANTKSVEVLRSNEWALRFQVAGRDPAVQSAEVRQAHATLDTLLKKTTGGVAYGRLLSSNKAKAVLFTSYLNNPRDTEQGMHDAVTALKAERTSDAKLDAAAKKAWSDFAWPTASPNWATYYTAPAQARFDELAATKMLAHTHNPAERARIIKKHFP